MIAPEIQVRLSTGEAKPLRQLYDSGPVALVFLRHLGCPLCGLQVASLQTREDLNVVFVTRAGPADTEAYRKEKSSTRPFLVDEDGGLFQAFGLGPGSMGALFNLRTASRGAFAVLQGHRLRRPRTDPRVLGGAFVLDRVGRVTWQHRAKHAADHPRLDELAEALVAAEKEV